jgi:hypothetical protein
MRRTQETKSVTVTSGAVVAIGTFGFTAALLAEANAAKISCTGNNINYTETPQDPSATLGHPVIKTASLTSNAPTLIERKENVANLKMIGLGGSAEVTITIYR